MSKHEIPKTAYIETKLYFKLQYIHAKWRRLRKAKLKYLKSTMQKISKLHPTYLSQTDAYVKPTPM